MAEKSDVDADRRAAEAEKSATETYPDILSRLSRLERQIRERPSKVEKPEVSEPAEQFLTEWNSGGGYVSGLYLAASLILRTELSLDDVDEEIVVDRQPERELLQWALSLGLPDSTPVLSAEAFEYCLGRNEWRTLLFDTQIADEGGEGLTNEQIQELANGALEEEYLVPMVRILRERDLVDDSVELLEAYLDERPSVGGSVALLTELDELGLSEQYRRTLRRSLELWRPEDGEQVLAELVERGRVEEFYDGVLLAVSRWKRASNWETVPEDERQILAGAVEGLLRRDGNGRADALALYREHLLPAESLTRFAPDLYHAAERAEDEEVIEDIVQNYESPEELSSEVDGDSDLLVAKVAERKGRWDEAFEAWRSLLEDDPSREAIERAIENRIAVLDVDTAEDLVQRLEEAGHPTRASAYAILAADARDETRPILDVVDEDPEVFETSGPLDEAVSEAFVRALCSLGRWDRLETHLDVETAIDSEFRRFYLRIAKVMQFVGEDESSMDGEEAVNLVERLLTSPMDTERLRLLLNLEVVDKLDNRLRSSFPEAHGRIDVVRGMLEILISLHAERLVEGLGEAGEDTTEYEEQLEETTLGRGGRQLLSTLSRRARRAGVISEDAHHGLGHRQ